MAMMFTSSREIAVKILLAADIEKYPVQMRGGEVPRDDQPGGLKIASTRVA
jgi:hypothetical protein